MPVTAAQQQKLILIKLGDHDDTGPVAPVIQALWEMHADKALIPNGPRLQYLYTLKEAIGIVLGVALTDRAVEVGVRQVSLKALENDLRLLLKTTQEEIEKIERQAAYLRPPARGQLKRTAPIMPGDRPDTAGMPDPNDRAFRGDPLLPRVRRPI